jgi:hypothetical protein
MNSTFALYPGVGHSISDEMFDDIAEFFLQALPEPMARYLDPSGRQGPP